jgi:hypothetical protein
MTFSHTPNVVVIYSQLSFPLLRIRAVRHEAQVGVGECLYSKGAGEFVGSVVWNSPDRTRTAAWGTVKSAKM